MPQFHAVPSPRRYATIDAAWLDAFEPKLTLCFDPCVLLRRRESAFPPSVSVGGDVDFSERVRNVVVVSSVSTILLRKAPGPGNETGDAAFHGKHQVPMELLSRRTSGKGLPRSLVRTSPYGIGNPQRVTLAEATYAFLIETNLLKLLESTA